MSDQDFYVRNAVEHLAGDLDLVNRSELLTDAQRTAALVWVLDGRVCMDGIGGWVESHGPRSNDVLTALNVVGALGYADLLGRAFGLFPTRNEDNPDVRLSAMDAWTEEQSAAFTRAQNDYFGLRGADDLVDNYLRLFVSARPQDFPISISDRQQRKPH